VHKSQGFVNIYKGEAKRREGEDLSEFYIDSSIVAAREKGKSALGAGKKTSLGDFGRVAGLEVLFLIQGQSSSSTSHPKQSAPPRKENNTFTRKEDGKKNSNYLEAGSRARLKTTRRVMSAMGFYIDRGGESGKREEGRGAGSRSSSKESLKKRGEGLNTLLGGAASGENQGNLKKAK